MKSIRLYILAVILGFLIAFAYAFSATAQQLQPDAKRVKQIQDALVANGFTAGKNWNETKEICRKIANDHKWQTSHAPDARVLGCVLHLGNPQFDSDVCTGSDHLDRAQRGEGN